MTISPANMPMRKTPLVARAPRAPDDPRPQFKIAVGYPRCGRQRTTIWVDTGILLSMGADDTLPDRFANHFRSRAQVCRSVTEELRWNTKD